MTKILFVCNGNSCRSQMAEGWLNTLGHNGFVADSGGIEPQGLNPLAVTVMAEKKVDISQQRSKELSQEQLNWADLVITVCGDASETCPVLPPGTQSEHWSLMDPAQAKGSKEDILKTFRQTSTLSTLYCRIQRFCDVSHQGVVCRQWQRPCQTLQRRGEASQKCPKG